MSYTPDPSINMEVHQKAAELALAELNSGKDGPGWELSGEILDPAEWDMEGPNTVVFEIVRGAEEWRIITTPTQNNYVDDTNLDLVVYDGETPIIGGEDLWNARYTKDDAPQPDEDALRKLVDGE